jgi:DNA-binding response OmpR family regulator
MKCVQNIEGPHGAMRATHGIRGRKNGAAGEECKHRMGAMPIQILLVEDDRAIADLICWALSDAGHEVRYAGSVSEARRLWRERLPDLLVADLLLPDGLGTEVIDEILQHADGLSPPSLVMSAMPQACEYASRAGADACMSKPFDIERLLGTVQQLVERRRNRHGPEARY